MLSNGLSDVLPAGRLIGLGLPSGNDRAGRARPHDGSIDCSDSGMAVLDGDCSGSPTERRTAAIVPAIIPAGYACWA
ncbi:MAG: hypothetical protein WC732_08640 [Candidatus Omnitrophota bacterium]